MVTITTPTDKTVSAMVLPGKNYSPVRIQAVITETNPALSFVGATLDWNDGTPPVVFTPAKPITIDVTRNLFFGTYYVTLTAFNYAQPKREQKSVYFSVDVQPETRFPVPQDYLFGPILPLDDGFPNSQQWNFNIGTNLDVLKSSVKMLLITTKGERIMLPTYGTLLRRAIFQPNTDSITTIIQQEITEALNQFEPRVSLQAFTIQAQPNSRVVNVNATFLSKVSQSTFALSLPFTK